MGTEMARMSRWVAWATILVMGLGGALPAEAARPRSARGEYREGMREIARERREMRRDIMNSGSRAEANRAYREGMREIARERREMRWEVGREVREGAWRRERARRVVAGVVLGAAIVVAVRGVAPPPPSPELCWIWTDSYRERGYWDTCSDY